MDEARAGRLLLVWIRLASHGGWLPIASASSGAGSSSIRVAGRVTAGLLVQVHETVRYELGGTALTSTDEDLSAIGVELDSIRAQLRRLAADNTEVGSQLAVSLGLQVEQ